MNPKLDALVMQATCGIFADDVFGGTGSLISAAGHVITSSGILKPDSRNENFEIRFSDDKPLRAKLEKEYPQGIAVLKIENIITGRHPLEVKISSILKGRALMCGYLPDKPGELLQVDGQFVPVNNLLNLFRKRTYQ